MNLIFTRGKNSTNASKIPVQRHLIKSIFAVAILEIYLSLALNLSSHTSPRVSNLLP